jgi:hypothetical protein
VRFLPDARLYHDTAYCLEFARRISPGGSAGRTIFHFYWHGPFGRKPAFALKSFLATQDMENCQAWLWLDSASPQEAGNPHLAELAPWIVLRDYDPLEQARGTPFEAAPALAAADDPRMRSDAFRLIALYRHGGVYMDIDTLFLRDFRELLASPLGESPFVYRWSAHCPYFSNAIIYIPHTHPLALQLMLHCLAVGSCHSRIAFRHEDHADKDLLELPCPLFDPLWPHFDGQDRYAGAPFNKFEHFFRPFGLFHRRDPAVRGLEDFFPGAFAYQWHGCWRMPEHENSYFGLFERQVDERFRRRRETLPRV